MQQPTTNNNNDYYYYTRLTYIHTYIHTNLYSTKNRENESEASFHEHNLGETVPER